VGVVDDDIQMTTTLLCLALQLVHHFIESTDIDTTDINTTTILVLLVLVLSNCSTPCITASAKVKVKVTLRPTISRPVRLGVRRPSGTRDQFFFLLEFFFQTVPVRYLVASSLTRGRVCNLLLLLVPASAVSLLPALSDERWVCLLFT
jgi:hypothetical protein